MKEERKKPGAERLLLVAALALVVVGAAFMLRESGFFEKYGSVEELRELIDRAGIWAGVVYFFMQMMTVIVAPIPSNVTMMAGALALGFWPALLIGVGAVLAGSTLVFLAARRLGQNAVHRMVDRGVMEKYLPVIEEKQDMFLFLTMLFPFFPDDMLCILAGVTTIPLRRYLCIVALARPWGLAFAALLGSGAVSMPAWAWAVLAAGMVSIFVLALKYSQQIENKLFEIFRRICKGRRDKNERNKMGGIHA